MRLQIDARAIEQEKQRIMRIAKDIKNTDDVLREVGTLGQQYALTIAPEYTGNLKAAILSFPQGKEVWVIVSRMPDKDTIPINVLFDEGTYTEVTGNIPRDPNSIGFMYKTTEFLKEEFATRLNLFISRVLQ